MERELLPTTICIQKLKVKFSDVPLSREHLLVPKQDKKHGRIWVDITDMPIWDLEFSIPIPLWEKLSDHNFFNELLSDHWTEGTNRGEGLIREEIRTIHTCSFTRYCSKERCLVLY